MITPWLTTHLQSPEEATSHDHVLLRCLGRGPLEEGGCGSTLHVAVVPPEDLHMWTLEVHAGLRYKERSMFPSPVEVYHTSARFLGFSVSRHCLPRNRAVSMSRLHVPHQ